MSRQAVILAGGAGTRLRDRLGDLPKPMIPIAGKPLLEHQVELCRRHGFTDLIFFVHHRAELIQQHFGNGAPWQVNIRYVVESQPLGTAGAVLAGWDFLAERFVVLYGDTMLNVDLQRLWQAHDKAQADASLLLHPNDHPLDSDLVEVNAAGRITAFYSRPHPPGVWRQNLVNAALYVLEKSALAPFRPSAASAPSAPTVLDFGHDVFPALLRNGRTLHGYNSPEYIKDIGKPERYDRVCREFESGTIARSSLEAKQRAVFLDRDGTLIVDKPWLCREEDLELLPGVAQAVHELNHQAWRTVVVTNQPVIARGECDEAGLQRIHNKLETLLGLEHAFLDRIYYCPHHPDRGFPGERADLKISCPCRKPRIGLIERAVRELNIDLGSSWLVGDSTTDLQTARNAGLRSVLVQTGLAGQDGKFSVRPDHVAANLRAAVQFILEQEQQVAENH
jgi:histidinol-phosphate phosphatase family protein